VLKFALNVSFVDFDMKCALSASEIHMNGVRMSFFASKVENSCCTARSWVLSISHIEIGRGSRFLYQQPLTKATQIFPSRLAPPKTVFTPAQSASDADLGLNRIKLGTMQAAGVTNDS
jgi:hypothetical protein